MEGRWAQLTIDAHIAGAIDYSRPVKPFIELAVLERMDLLRDLQYSALYPALSEDKEGELIRTNEWVTRLKTKLKPWLNNIPIKTREEDLREKIAFLEQLNNERNE